MKKTLLIVIAAVTVVISASLLCFVSSAAGPTVYSPESVITASPGETLTVPVCVRDDPGIMGIHIVVGYPEGLLTPTKVARGECLTAGNFADSIGTGTDGAIDVIWSNTENVTTDGVLFEVTFDVSDDPSAIGGSISFSIVADDTFNESWEDVSFNTEGVFVTVPNEEGEDILSATESDESETEDAATDTESVTTPVDSDESVSDETEKVERIIVESIGEALEVRNIPSITEVPEEQRDEFVNSVIGAAEEKITAGGSTDEAAQDVALFEDMIADITFDDLVKLSGEAGDSSEPGTEKESVPDAQMTNAADVGTAGEPAPVKKVVIAVIVIVSAAAVAAAVVVLVRKKQNK